MGRESIVEGLLAKLQGQTRLLWIKGISGIGKTTLGECLASKGWEKERSFEWIYLEILEGQSPDFASVAAELLAKLGDRELDPQERNNPDRLAKRLLQKLQSHSYWIQMDSLERLLNPEQPNEFLDAYWATFLQRFLTESSLVSRLVLTAQAIPTELAEFSDRYPNTWAEYQLNGLLQLEQLEFFAKRGVVVEPSNQDILTRIAKIYEGHPLVLKVIAEDILKEFAGDVSRYWQIYQPEFEQVARELQATRLDETEYNEALDRKVRERIKKSLEKLPVDALDLLCRSAVFRRPVPKKFWLAMIKDRSSQQQKVAYRVLGDRTLIEKEGTDIRQHNLICSVAYDLLKANTVVWTSAERQAAHLWLTAYEPALDAPNLEKVRGYLEAFDHYCQISDWDNAKEIVFSPINSLDNNELLWQLDIWGYYKEEIHLCQMLLNKINLSCDVLCFKGIGNAYIDLGEYSQSSSAYQKSLNIAQKIDDLFGEGRALLCLGLNCHYQGEYYQAVNYYEHSLIVAKKAGDRLGEAKIIGNLALSYHHLGNYSDAINYNHQALQIFQEVNDIRGEEVTLNNLALTYSRLGIYEESIRSSEKALVISRKICDPSLEASILETLGATYYHMKIYDRSIEHCQEALKIARAINDPWCEAIALSQLGRTLIKVDSFTEALESLQSSMIICQKIGLREYEAESLKYLAELHQAMGEFEVAQQYCQQALSLAKELDIPLVAECEALQLKMKNEK